MFSESHNDRRPHGRRLPQGSRQADNAAVIGDNSAEIEDGAAGAGRDRRYLHERDPMLNSVLNGDWSNSVPGRQIPEGTGQPP